MVLILIKMILEQRREKENEEEKGESDGKWRRLMGDYDVKKNYFEKGKFKGKLDKLSLFSNFPLNFPFSK